MFLETILNDAVRGYEDVRQPPSAIAGRWRNRWGSTMELTVDTDHRVHGTFHAVMGAVDPSRAFAVTGYAEGEALVFCVDFGRRGSVAAWSGHHIVDDQGERLVTLWHLARPVEASQGVDLSRAMMAGADEFVRSET